MHVNNNLYFIGANQHYTASYVNNFQPFDISQRTVKVTWYNQPQPAFSAFMWSVGYIFQLT